MAAKPYTLDGITDRNGTFDASTITVAPRPTATGAASVPSVPIRPASITAAMPTTAPKIMQRVVLRVPANLPPEWK